MRFDYGYKIGKKEHLEQLQQGILYCNSFQFFTELEDSNIRGDRYENYNIIMDSSNTKVWVNGMNIPVTGKIRNRSGWTPEFPTHMFCFGVFSIEIPFKEFCLQDYIKLDGYEDADSILIFDFNEFSPKLKKYVENKNDKAQMGLIKYIDIENNKSVLYKDFFTKDISYQWQREGRVCFWLEPVQKGKSIKFTDSLFSSEIFPLDYKIIIKE